MERYICIHGHFYQPPRENPWLEEIEVQDSAYPFHDWNERVTAECYAPNAASRILDDQNRIVRIVNNYSKISFNMGPTLLAWMENKFPDIYQAILEADKESAARFSGHSSAMAQVYNHVIMPLANRRDKETQVIWGLSDFERRFGHRPEGMWLAETAVDLESLEIMAEQGIQFTILAPNQARRARAIGAKEWPEGNGGIDPSRAYLINLPSGRSISLFFYDGPISRAIAFEGLLSRGEHYVERLMAGFSDERSWPQLVHVATDGESYGHHHRFGDMALAYALERIESEKLAVLTNYGEFLEIHPPTHEVEIYENSSWSCAHGVERWRCNCGCNTGGQPGWNQEWRAPLREALDWLRDRAAALYEERGRDLFDDPWAARNAYISVVLDRSPENVSAFFRKYGRREFNAQDRVHALKLLELQRNAMLMYTSCGWFFSELSGIETVQVIQYAGRALQLAQELFGDGLEEGFLSILERAKSNVSTHEDGRRIFEKFVRPAKVDLDKLCAHYAMSSLFEAYPEEARIYCFRANLQRARAFETGHMKLAAGEAQIASLITEESERFTFCALHLGDHNLYGGVRVFDGPEPFESLTRDMAVAFSRADMAEVIRLLDREFGASTHSLRTLFRDEQRKVLDLVLQPLLAEAEASYRQLYEHHAPLIRFLDDINVPLPESLHTAAAVILNIDLRRALEDISDIGRVHTLLDEAQLWNVQLDRAGLGYVLTTTIDREADEFVGRPHDAELLAQFAAIVEMAREMPFEVNLWKAQNRYYEILQHVYPHQVKRAEQGDGEATLWIDQFSAFGRLLWVHVE